jgi:Tetratricopeptide repeat
MGPLHTILIAISLLLVEPVAFGQNADWSRLIATGDEAMNKHQYAQAEASYREALKIAEQHWKKDARLSGSLIKLAESSNAQSKKEEAEDFANRSVATMEEALKAHKPKNATDEIEQVGVSAALFNKAGEIFATHQKYSEAEAMYQKVIAAREKYATDQFPSKPNNEDFLRFMAQSLGDASIKLADADDKLADLYRSEHKIQEATVLYQESETLREKQYGPDKPQVVKSLNDLATCYSLQGRYDQAEPLYKRVMGILQRSGYGEGPEMATALENYALLLKKTAREAEAKDVLEKATAIRAKSATTQK